MAKTKTFRLNLPLDRSVSRESVYKALVDAIIRLTGEKLPYVCIKASADGKSLALHLADQELDSQGVVLGTIKGRVA